MSWEASFVLPTAVNTETCPRCHAFTMAIRSPAKVPAPSLAPPRLALALSLDAKLIDIRLARDSHEATIVKSHSR